MTLQLMLWPAASVSGKVSPETRKPFPVTVDWEMVRPLVLAFVSVSTCGWLLPTFTKPKLMLVGLTPSCGVVDVAVPDNGRTAV